MEHLDLHSSDRPVTTPSSARLIWRSGASLALRPTNSASLGLLTRPPRSLPKDFTACARRKSKPQPFPPALSGGAVRLPGDTCPAELTGLGLRLRQRPGDSSDR